MIEKLLFSSLEMPGETIRIAIALIGTILTVYFDIFNNRNVPNNLLYAFLVIAFITSIIFFSPEIMLYSLFQFALVALAGFALYKMGQVGGADIFVLSSIVLLLPILPSAQEPLFNFPLLLPLLLYAGVAFAVYSIFYFGKIIMHKKNLNPNYLYLLLIIPYFLFAWLFLSAPFFSPVYFLIASLLLLSSIFFLVFRSAIYDAISEKILISKLLPDGDVLAKEKMAPLMKKLNIGPVIEEKELKILKKAKVKEVWIYSKLPPFLPFILLGLLASLFFGNMLFLVF